MTDVAGKNRDALSKYNEGIKLLASAKKTLEETLEHDEKEEKQKKRTLTRSSSERFAKNLCDCH